MRIWKQQKVNKNEAQVGLLTEYHHGKTVKRTEKKACEGRRRQKLIKTVVQSLCCVWLWTCGLQHTGLPCPSLSSGICSDSCPLSRWCHTIISSSVAHFPCPQSFPASGSFPVSWFFTSGGQRLGASASASVPFFFFSYTLSHHRLKQNNTTCCRFTQKRCFHSALSWRLSGSLATASVLPMNIQDWFPLGFTGLILLSKGLWRIFSSTTVWKHQFCGAQPSLWSNSHISTWLLEKHSFH